METVRLHGNMGKGIHPTVEVALINCGQLWNPHVPHPSTFVCKTWFENLNVENVALSFFLTIFYIKFIVPVIFGQDEMAWETVAKTLKFIFGIHTELSFDESYVTTCIF